jgi:hypothetical protein
LTQNLAPIWQYRRQVETSGHAARSGTNEISAGIGDVPRPGGAGMARKLLETE